MGSMRCDSTDIAGHMQYLYTHPSDPSAAAMTSFLQRLIARWRDRSNRNQRQTFMHSRWGDMAITSPAEGSWNGISPETTPNQLGDEFPTGYTPELLIGGYGPGGMDAVPVEQRKSRMRCFLERLRLRTSQPEQSTPSMSNPRDTFAGQSEARSKKSSSTGRSQQRVIYTPINREELAIANPLGLIRQETATSASDEPVAEQSDDDSMVCPTEFSDIGPMDTFPTVISRSINEEEADCHFHNCYDGMDRIYDGTFEPRPSTLERMMTTGSPPGLASTAFMRSSSQNKHSSIETWATKTTRSSQSSSGQATTAFMRSSSWTGRQTETPATSVTSSPKMTTPSIARKKQKKNKKQKPEPESVGHQELVPSYEELFG